MRGNSHRLACSPYYIGSAVLVILFLFVKYYSLSASHDAISERLIMIEKQLAKCEDHKTQMDSTLTEKAKAERKCITDFETLRQDMDIKDDQISKMKSKLANAQNEQVKYIQ